MKRHNRRKSLSGWASSAALALFGAALVPAAPQSQFEGVTEVVLVEVPVQVVRDGRPVRGLTRDDFEIYDGRKRQEIVGFDVIDLGQVEPESGPAVPELPVSARRHFLFLFDLSFAEPGSVTRAREAARDLVAEGLHPADLAAVATYSASRGVRVVLGFTSDRQQLAVALDTLGLAEPAERVREPLGIVIVETEAAQRQAASAGPGAAATARYPTISDRDPNSVGDLQTLSGRVGRDQQKNQVLALTTSLEELAKLMNSVSGRKHVVYLSEGFDSSVLLGNLGVTEEDRTRAAELNEAAAHGEFWKVDNEERFGDSGAQRGVESMLEELRRADCTVQAVDVGGVRAGGDLRARASGDDGLFIMANETGGELYRNYNDLSEAMGQMLERTAVTYVLAFQPQGLELDGSYHRLRVKLKGDARGARVVHRPGYYALKRLPERQPLEQQLSLAGAIVGGGDGGSLRASALAVPFPGADKAYVPVLLEVDGPSLLAGGRREVMPLEIYAYAFDRNGTVHDFFAQTLKLDLAQSGGALRQAGFKFWGHFDLPPDDYVIRILVRDADSGAVGMKGVSLRVPAAGDGEPALLPPLLAEPMGKWVFAREEGAEQATASYPFMMGEQPFIPAAKPVLSSGQPTPLAVYGFNLGAGDLVIDSRLLRPDGAAVQGAKVEVDVGREAASDGSTRLVGTLRLGSVPAGEYRLEVVVTDSATGQEHSSSLPVVVEG
ncbi:MAG: VWA domain-containing protein [Thermoanaerobaculia bacterium]